MSTYEIENQGQDKKKSKSLLHDIFHTRDVINIQIS